MLYGAIEAGGTKFVCAVGTGPDDLRAVERFPTTLPAETLGRALAFFRRQPEPIAALGVGSFGPVDLDAASPTYGHVTSTPKAGWAGAAVVAPLGEALGVPVAFDTDVNAAALGEHRWGAARGLHTFVYLTVGTGIGGGALVEGRRLHGVLHPEMGHVPVPREAGDAFAGTCPYHGDCLEGLAAGPALAARWGQPAEALAPGHPAWDLEARYLASALAGYVLTLAPQRLILGGGVMQQAQLFPLVRRHLLRRLGGYFQARALTEAVDTYVVPPALGDRAGVLGGLALAQEAAATA